MRIVLKLALFKMNYNVFTYWKCCLAIRTVC